MEIQETIQESIHPLFDKFEDYTKTSVELAKLKTISKTGDIVSIMAFQLLAFIFLTLFVLVGSFALALYLGTLFGHAYYGFLIVTGFYAFTCIVLYLLKKPVKSMIKKTFVVHYLD
ncbi:MAG: hypothetical protein K0R65_1845 [Crocinitomicaceae bacterium]|jgi:hypothetical protein|nr:hypothetical protein [Crocinitomicaceae bacterium]